MPTQRYALESGGDKRLEVSWKGMWKNFTITLGGNVVGTIAGQKELKAGQDFELPDGSVLHVQLVQKFSSTELQTLRDGEPLPGSASDPEQQLKAAYGIIFFVAGLNIVLGAIAALFEVEFLYAIGIGWSSIIFGAIFLVLGFFVKRESVAALILAIAIFALDGIVGFFLAVGQGAMPTGGIVARIILLIPMVQGVGAIRTIKQQRSQAGS